MKYMSSDYVVGSDLLIFDTLVAWEMIVLLHSMHTYSIQAYCSDYWNSIQYMLLLVCYLLLILTDKCIAIW